MTNIELINNIISELALNFSEEDLLKIKKCLDFNFLLYENENLNCEFKKIDQFIIAKQLEGKSIETLKNYELIIGNFLKSLKCPLKEITTEKIRYYLYNYQQERKISNRSLEQIRHILNSFFKWCIEERFIVENPMERIKAIKYIVEPRTSINSLDLEKIREACDNTRDKAIVEFLFSTGVRVSELCHALKTDVNFEEKTVQILGKGGKYREVYLNARAELALIRYLESRDDDNPSLFVGLRRPHKSLERSGVEAIIRRIKNKTDISDNITPHRFRHTTATVALQNGMSVQEVQKIMGHSNINTTMIYAEVDTEEIKLKAKKLINQKKGKILKIFPFIFYPLIQNHQYLG